MGLKSYPRVYFELLLSAFMLIMGMSLASTFLPLFAYDLDPVGFLVGFVSSAWFFSRIFTELPSGILADTLGRRKLLIGGLVLSAVGAFLCSMADRIHILILGRALWGLGTGLFFMSSSATVFDLFKSSDRGQALGTFQALEFIGSFIGAPIGSFMVGFMGYRGVFLASCGFMVCSSLTAFFSRELRQMDLKSTRPTRSTLDLTDVLPRFKNWGLTAIYINSFSSMLIWAGITGTVFPLYLNLDLGINVELIGIIISIRTLGMIFATAISGRLSDAFGRKPMILLGMSLEAGCLYAYTSTSSLEMILLIGLIEGSGCGMVLTSSMVLLSEVVPQQSRGSAIGMYRTFMDVGGFVGPLFFMMVFDSFGSYTTFLTAVATIVLTITLVLPVKAPDSS